MRRRKPSELGTSYLKLIPLDIVVKLLFKVLELLCKVLQLPFKDDHVDVVDVENDDDDDVSMTMY